MPSLRLLAALLALPLLAGCARFSDELPPPVDRDLAEIAERDTLTALTTYNSTSYFLYRGQPLGYEYELLKAFAADHDLVLKMRVVSDSDSLFILLNEGAGDVVAARLVPDTTEGAGVLFTHALYHTRPSLVQQTGDEADLPDSVDSVIVEGAEAADTTTEIVKAIGEAEGLPESVNLNVRLISRPSQLAGEDVHLPGNSPYEGTLIELSDSLTGDIHVVELGGDVAAEELIRRVAAGTVDFTVSQENVAELKEEYYTNIAVRPTMGPSHEVAWAVRENAPDLRLALSEWIGSGENEQLFAQLYRKYFVDREGYRERAASEYLTGETGVLSAYDDLFRAGAEELGWDWRLLASQCYQESRFEPRARSWAGAAGLLQLMPPTAREFGVSNVYDPENNVAGAVRFLQWLTDYWDDKIPDPDERRKFILASYNTGHGHVEDARRLTAKHDGNDTNWEEVAFWLLQKSKREVYTDPVVKYGFARGLEPVTYVTLILERYEHYEQFVVDGAEGEAPPPPPPPTTAPPEIRALDNLGAD